MIELSGSVTIVRCDRFGCSEVFRSGSHASMIRDQLTLAGWEFRSRPRGAPWQKTCAVDRLVTRCEWHRWTNPRAIVTPDDDQLVKLNEAWLAAKPAPVFTCVPCGACGVLEPLDPATVKIATEIGASFVCNRHGEPGDWTVKRGRIHVVWPVGWRAA